MNEEIQATSIAQRINDEYALMAGDMTRAVQRAIKIGEMLTEAKAEVAHGQWIPWVEKNLAFGRVQASRYMKIAANVSSSTHLIEQAKTINEAVALLAEPKEQSDIEPKLDDQNVEYVTPPEVQQELDDMAKRAADAEARLSKAERENERAMKQYRSVSTQLDHQKLELDRLKKLEADKQKVEETMRSIHELEKKKQDLFADAESMKVVHQVLVRSREFFTRECMQIPALKLRPQSIEGMRQDFAGLIELVENWLQAMKERFQ